MPRCYIEPLSAAVRIYADETAPPSPYDWCATLRWVKPKTVEIVGVAKPITKEQLRALRKAMRDFGILRYTYHRWRDGRDIFVTHDLSKEES